jgi:serine/threonine-protein kinase
MKCPSCGAALDDGARFCGHCGSKLGAAPASAQVGTAATIAVGTGSGAGGAAARPASAVRDEPRAPVAPQRTPSGKSAPGLGGDATMLARPGGAAAVARPGAVAPAQPPAPAAPISIGAAPAGGDPYLGALLNNRFRIEAKLGEGGFGAVYRGSQVGIGRQVAIKLLHPEMTRDQNLVARFRREGSVLCSLRDAHTITTYDFDQTADGTLYIAMELLEGRSLHDVFHAEAPIAWQRMFKIMTEMCSSLYEAHSQGIVHRDLKPENIYLEKRPGNPEFVKILDFGIAKVMRGEVGGSQAPQLTATGQTLGTLEYMSPEQLMGKQLDGASDVYAVGVVSYELITGRLPFPDAVGPAALISAQLKKVPDAPSVALPTAGIPAAVDRVILRMLEKDPKARFKDVMELSRACEEVLAVAQSSSAPRIAGAPGAAAPAAGPGPASASSVYVTIGDPSRGAGAPASPQAAPGTASAAPAARNRASTPAPARAPRPPPSETDQVDGVDATRKWLWLAAAIVLVGGLVGAILALR